MLESIEQIRKLPVRDATLVGLRSDYESCEILIEDSQRARWAIVLSGYVAISFVGHWDESIVDRIEILQEDELIAGALAEIEKRYRGAPEEPGGGTREFSGPWHLVRVWLIDDTKLEVVGQAVTLREEQA